MSQTSALWVTFFWTNPYYVDYPLGNNQLLKQRLPQAHVCLPDAVPIDTTSRLWCFGMAITKCPGPLGSER